MAFNKSNLVVLAVVLALVATLVSAADFNEGIRKNKDELVCSYKIDLKAKDGRAPTTLKRCAVKKFDQLVSYVKAKDLGSGGHVAIVDGGLERKFVKLEFKNEVGKGLHYEVEVYASKIKSRQ